MLLYMKFCICEIKTLSTVVSFQFPCTRITTPPFFPTCDLTLTLPNKQTRYMKFIRLSVKNKIMSNIKALVMNILNINSYHHLQ